MAETLAFSIAVPAASTGGSSEAVDLSQDGIGLRRVASVSLDVSTGPGDLSVVIETSRDQSVWTAVERLIPGDGPVSAEALVGGLERYLRASWTLTGGAAFVLNGVADQCYATIEQLVRYGLPESIMRGLERETLWRALLASTGEARSYVAKGATSTISDVGTTLAQCVAQMASLDLLAFQIGVDSNSQAIELLTERVAAARAWLKDVGRGNADSGAVFVDDSTDTAGGAQGHGESDPVRDWTALAP